MHFSRQFNLVVSIFLATLFSFSYGGVTLYLDGGNLNYESTDDIAGFQFSHNGFVTSAGGGDAEDAGFGDIDYTGIIAYIKKLSKK